MSLCSYHLFSFAVLVVRVNQSVLMHCFNLLSFQLYLQVHYHYPATIRHKIGNFNFNWRQEVWKNQNDDWWFDIRVSWVISPLCQNLRTQKATYVVKVTNVLYLTVGYSIKYNIDELWNFIVRTSSWNC